ncbi:MAG: hypothetical protein JWL84_3366 [Rhodospirillales bacterium]|jgi:hypothetical protein|nr:hypothetical protein [Rhodospirillales bacterium]
MIRLVISAIVVAVAAFAPTEGRANGLFEKDWQFQDPSTLSARATMEDMRQKQTGGYYNNFAPGSTTNNSTVSIGNMTTVTAGNQTTVSMTGTQTNNGSQTGAGELNGSITSLSGH